MASNSRYQRNAPTLGNCADLDASTRQDAYTIVWNESEGTHKYIQQGVDPTTDQRLTALEDTYVKSSRFAIISSGTSGTVTKPEGSTIILDDFGGTVDAIITGVSGTTPNMLEVYDADSEMVATTFDANGNYVLSAAPVDYPVAIIYRVRQKFKDYVDNDADVLGESDFVGLQDISHSLHETGRSGFTEWLGSGNYWSWTPGNPGTFTLLRGGEGYIRHREVYFAGNQTVTLAYGDYKFLYIDEDGILQKSDTNSREDKQNRINLFLVQNDAAGEFIAIRNNHLFTLDSGAREWMDAGFGVVVANEGSDISRYGTGTGASTTDRMVNISAGTLIDADIVESWSAVTSGITVNHTYRAAGGNFLRDSYQQQFPMKWNNAGTPTALNNGEFGVYRLFMIKSSLNDSPPQFISEMHTAVFGNATQAATAIANNTISNFGRLNNELCQVGFVTVAMNASGGYVSKVDIAKVTFRQVTGGTGVGSTAINVVTDVSAFDKVLSATDTTVQTALNTIDEVAQRKDSIGATILAATEKTTPVDADMVGLMDSAASNVLKKLSWSNIKATMKAYMDELYPPITPVYAHYTESAGLTIANTNILRWDTKVEDTHNAVTTGSGWKFTAPSSGVYEVQVMITFAATAITAGQVYGYRGVFVDGSGTNIKALAAEEVEANLTRGSRVHTTFSVRLSADSYFQIQALASANRAQLNDAVFNWIHIRKVSN